MTDLEILRADLAAARLPGRKRRVAMLVAVAAVTVTAVAVAANRYLSQPAPAHVRATFERFGLWQQNAAGQVNTSTAKVMAFSKHAVLYGAETRRGGRCLELLGDHGFVYQLFCLERRGDGLLLFTNITAVHGTAGHLPPVVVSGQAGRNVASVEARIATHVEKVPLGLDGTFTYEPRDQDAARRGRLVLYARDHGGSVVAREHAAAPLILDAKGSPPRVVRGVSLDPRARHAFFQVWAVQPTSLGSRCRGPGCTGNALGQTGTTRAVDIAPGGRFTFVTPRLRYRRWSLSLVITDARFLPLTGSDTTFVPDAVFWRKAAREAR